MSAENEVELNVLHQGLTYDQYHKMPGVRSSELRLMMRSPAHCQAAKIFPKKTTPAMKYGKIFHAAVENGEKFLDTLHVEPIFKGFTKDGKETTSANSIDVKEKRAAWWDTLPTGAMVVTEEEKNKIVFMFEALMQNKLLCSMIKDSVRETSLAAIDNETGLTIKCRPDLITKSGHILDFKTTAYPDERLFLAEIYNHKYPGDRFYALQAAHYTHCMRMAGIGNPESFVFVAVENEPPYSIAVYPIGIGGLGAGDQWRSFQMKRYKECMDRNHWPFNNGRAVQLDPPDWFQVPT